MILALLLAASGSDVRLCDKASAVQCQSVDATGAAKVNATQSTSPWVTSDNHTTAGAPLSCELSTGAAFYDARSIRALTSADVVSAAQSGAWTNACTQSGAWTNACTQSGTWTVQPGNTANTTPWLFDLNKVAGTATVTGGLAGSHGVGGLAADGAAVSGNPVLVAGKGFNGIVQTPKICDKRIAFTTLATTATVQQIALVAGQTIYVCGWYAIISTATTAVNVKWVTGTGSNCVTGIADVTPFIFTTPTAAPAISNWNQTPMSGAPAPFSASASALCITQSSATNSTTLSGVIFYTQN